MRSKIVDRSLYFLFRYFMTCWRFYRNVITLTEIHTNFALKSRLITKAI